MVTEVDDGGDSSGLNTDHQRQDYNSHSAKTGAQPFKKHLEREKRLRKGSRTGSKTMRHEKMIEDFNRVERHEKESQTSKDFTEHNEAL